jgi:hypothetical protein
MTKQAHRMVNGMREALKAGQRVRGVACKPARA